jgi:hypothetical protein
MTDYGIDTWVSVQDMGADFFIATTPRLALWTIQPPTQRTPGPIFQG